MADRRRQLAHGLALLLILFVPSFADSDKPHHAESAAVETVTVEGVKDLTGIWKFPPMEQASRGGDTFYDMGPEMYCRVGGAEPDFSLHCFDWWTTGSAALDEDEYGNVRFVWKAFDMRTGELLPEDHWVFNGTLKSKTVISGRLGEVHEAFRYEAPERVTVTKVVLSETAPDLGGQKAFLAKLLDEMASGSVSEPHDVPSWRLSLLTPDDLRPLGRELSVIYIADTTPKTGYKDGFAQYSDEVSSIYDVEFEKGERLCALHRRPDGVLDYFRCI
jgi:hypothetical protein